MSAKTELKSMLELFRQKQLECTFTIGKDIDFTPPSGSWYRLDTDSDVIKKLQLNKAQQEQLINVGEKLITLCFKKKKVLKFTSKYQVRTYVFEGYRDFLIVIRNEGKAHYYQNYQITITEPK
jgi:hypothetical protein